MKSGLKKHIFYIKYIIQPLEKKVKRNQYDHKKQEQLEYTLLKKYRELEEMIKKEQ